MGWTQKELEFLESNKELLEEGSSKLTEVIDKVIAIGRSSSDFNRGKMLFAIIYTIEGTNGFLVNVTSSYKTTEVKSAILNRTAAKATGVALLPAMFSNKDLWCCYQRHKPYCLCRV